MYMYIVLIHNFSTIVFNLMKIKMTTSKYFLLQNLYMYMHLPSIFLTQLRISDTVFICSNLNAMPLDLKFSVSSSSFNNPGLWYARLPITKHLSLILSHNLIQCSSSCKGFQIKNNIYVLCIILA
jgi:hypothetical protein